MTTETPKEAYPLTWPAGWPRTRNPTHSRFGSWKNKPSVAKGTDAMLDELRKLGASAVIISTNLQLRNDGLPRSNQAEPRDTGAAVYFKLKGKPRVLACDKWNTVGQNLYAIAQHVGALRGQERWGVGNIEQAFAGYAAIPERTGGVSWWDVLGVPLNAGEDQIKTAYRDKAKTAHPDTGGSHESMSRLNEAYTMALAQTGR